MNPPRNSSDRDWQAVLRLAREDTVPPPVNVAALLRVVRTEPLRAHTWLDDFYALTASIRLLAGCGGIAAFAAVVLLWETLDCSRLLAWAELIRMGGAS